MGTKKIMYLNSDCNCNALRINEDDYGVFLNHVMLSFSALQQPGFTKFKEAVKAIWCFLTGKEYIFYEIVLSSKEEVRKFKEFVASIDESKLNE